MRGPNQLSLPPLARSAKVIIAVNLGVWAVMLLLIYVAPEVAAQIAHITYLDPDLVLEGYLHQMVTYMFFHDLQTPFHVLMNMLLVYFFASPLDDAWGVKKTLWFTFGAGVAGGVMIMLFHLIGVGLGLGPGHVTLGFSGAALGMLAAFALLHAEATILLFFIVPMKAKYILPLALVVDFLMWVTPGSDLSFPAHLGGIVFGALYVAGPPGPEKLMMRWRYWRIRRELERRKKKKDDNVVQGPWIH